MGKNATIINFALESCDDNAHIATTRVIVQLFNINEFFSILSITFSISSKCLIFLSKSFTPSSHALLKKLSQWNNFSGLTKFFLI